MTANLAWKGSVLGTLRVPYKMYGRNGGGRATSSRITWVGDLLWGARTFDLGGGVVNHGNVTITTPPRVILVTFSSEMYGRAWPFLRAFYYPVLVNLVNTHGATN